MPQPRFLSTLCALAALVAGPAGASDIQWLAGAPMPPAGAPWVMQSWASWCGSCTGLAAELAGLARAHPGSAFVAVSVDEDVADARAAAARIGRAASGEVVIAWGGADWASAHAVSTVPTVRVLDAQGAELARIEGHPNAADLLALGQALDKALAGKPR